MSDGGEAGLELNGGQLQDFTIDQLAGATALVLGSIGGLLMIIWKSRCACRVRLGLSDKCYVFDCERKPPDPNEGGSSDEDTQTPNKPVTEAVEERERLREEQLLPEPEPEPEPEVNQSAPHN
jgi:hypothetical protein